MEYADYLKCNGENWFVLDEVVIQPFRLEWRKLGNMQRLHLEDNASSVHDQVLVLSSTNSVPWNNDDATQVIEATGNSCQS